MAAGEFISMESGLIVAIDTETTGLGHRNQPPRDDAVVQIGIAWRDASGNISTWGSLCNPGDRYFLNGRAEDALKVNGLGLTKIRSAKSDKLVAVELKKKLNEIARGHEQGIRLRAYNRKFDESFLSKEPWLIPSRLWGACIMEATRCHFGLLGGTNLKLEEALRQLNLKKPQGKMHNAEIDSYAALLVCEKLGSVSSKGMKL